MMLVCQVWPPSKLTASNIPDVIPASVWPMFVTITMLFGFVGLTAMDSSDSLSGRWLTSTFVGTGVRPTDVRVAWRAPAVVAASETSRATIDGTTSSDLRRMAFGSLHSFPVVGRAQKVGTNRRKAQTVTLRWTTTARGSANRRRGQEPETLR